MRTANAIAEMLKREGVDFVVGYPVNPIFEAAAEADIRTIIVRQERTGIHIADAFARMNSGDRVAVYLTQNGPGSENSFGGLAQAWSESAPMVAIPGGYARAQSNVAPNFSGLVNFQHVSKWTEQLTDANDLANAVRRAFTHAKNGRQRPVVLEIPGDLWGAEIEEPINYTPTPAYRSGPDPADARKAAQTLVNAERPVIYAGQGVHYARAWDQLKELAELLESPVTTSLQGKSAFPETHPLSLGSGGRAFPQAVHEFSARRRRGLRHRLLVRQDRFRSADAQGPVLHPLDARSRGLQQRGRDLRGRRRRRRAGARCDHRRGARADLRSARPRRRDRRERSPRSTAAGARTGRTRPARTTRRSTPTARCATCTRLWMRRSGSTTSWRLTTPVRRATRCRRSGTRPRRSATSAGARRRSSAPASVTRWAPRSRILRRPVVNVWGDAAIGMTGMDFETAVRENIPILSVLLNNFSMAIELPIMKTATEKYRATDISGHYADMAKAFGGYGERVESPEDLKDAFKRGIRATEDGQPALIEVITSKEIDYSVFR